jgi:pantoate kinase
VIKTAKAFAPAAISSFFQIHDTEKGKPITDLEKIGAIGGGFGLERGVLTTVTAEEASENSIKVYINSKLAKDAKTTEQVLQTLLSKNIIKYNIKIEHQIEVPIGTGFGTSAGGALTAGLALKDALDLPLTYNQIGKIAHVSEIQCQTGLGTVSSLTFSGGCVLVVEPGAPGICQIDRIPITPDHMIVAGFCKSKTPNKTILTSSQRKKEINQHGKETLDAILAKPTIAKHLSRLRRP